MQGLDRIEPTTTLVTLQRHQPTRFKPIDFLHFQRKSFNSDKKENYTKVDEAQKKLSQAFQNSNEKLEQVNSGLEMSAFVRGRVIKIIERGLLRLFLSKVVSFFQGLLFSAAGCSSNVHLKDISLQNKLEMQNFEKKHKKEKDGKLQRRLSEKKKNNLKYSK